MNLSKRSRKGVASPLTLCQCVMSSALFDDSKIRFLIKNYEQIKSISLLFETTNDFKHFPDAFCYCETLRKVVFLSVL